MFDARTKTIRDGFVDIDIKAREAAVFGAGQRIAPIEPAEMDEPARVLSGEIRRVFGVHDNTEIPSLFRTMMKHPGVYRCQLELGIELNRNSTLPPRDRELAVLRVAWLCGSPFEWGEHVKVGKQCGLTAKEIDRVKHGSSASDWCDHDRAVVRAAEELIDDHLIAVPTWQVLARSLSEAQLIELPALVGAYAMTAMIYNSLGFGLLEGNAGFSQT